MRLAAIAVALVGALASAAVAGAVVEQDESLRVSVDGRISPQRLPREGSAPIAVAVGWEIGTTDETVPPKLKTLRIEVNRNGRFDYAGLPTCPYPKIQPASSQRALSNCRSALVGQGRFSAIVALAGQEPYPAGGRLLLFNGLQGGKPVLFGHIYSAHPFATSFVIEFEVGESGKGAYGTVLTARLPKSLLNWGNLTGIEMKLSRRYGFEGRRHSYVSAGCPAPKGFPSATFPLGRASFSFAGGKRMSTVFSGLCRVRR